MSNEYTDELLIVLIKAMNLNLQIQMTSQQNLLGTGTTRYNIQREISMIQSQLDSIEKKIYGENEPNN